jgi:hypothetical protein
MASPSCESLFSLCVANLALRLPLVALHAPVLSDDFLEAVLDKAGSRVSPGILSDIAARLAECGRDVASLEPAFKRLFLQKFPSQPSSSSGPPSSPSRPPHAAQTWKQRFDRAAAAHSTRMAKTQLALHARPSSVTRSRVKKGRVANLRPSAFELRRRLVSPPPAPTRSKRSDAKPA